MLQTQIKQVISLLRQCFCNKLLAPEYSLDTYNLFTRMEGQDIDDNVNELEDTGNEKKNLSLFSSAEDL
jgi:hypothetical protein